MQTTSMSIRSALSKNLLYIPEITEHMFKFMTLTDIKNCRLVCQLWNQLAEQFLKRLSIVEIINPERAEEFNQEFPSAQKSRIFSSFRLGYYDETGFPVQKLVSFIEKWHHNLSEITLLSPDFHLEDKNKTYDLSPLLPSTLTKLHISSVLTDEIMIISTDKICNIRILQSEFCVLNIMPGTTLNSVEIDIKFVTFREGKVNVPEFLINPLLNFDVLKKATFLGENVKLDLQGSHSLDMLELGWGTEVVNWETSNWETKKLSLYVHPYFPYVKGELWKSPVKYKELDTSLTHLNVSLLLEGIEKLDVTFHSDQDQAIPPRISGKHNFPDLKYVHMSFPKVIDFSPFVEVFKHSPKLSALSVTLQSLYDTRDASILKTSSLPPSVKTLRVKNIRVILDHSLQLDSLIVHYVLNDALHNGIVQVAKDSHLKNLVCKLRPIRNTFADLNYTDISDIERDNFVITLIDLNLDNFVVGEFRQVNNSEFKKSYLFPFVDTQGKYYLFQRGKKGKAISESDAKMYRKATKNNCFQIK